MSERLQTIPPKSAHEFIADCTIFCPDSALERLGSGDHGQLKDLYRSGLVRWEGSVRKGKSFFDILRATQNLARMRAADAASSSTATSSRDSARAIPPTMSPRAWVSDNTVSACRQCRRVFNVIRRRHHCRICGQIFCDKCSANRVVASNSSSSRIAPVRACTACYFKHAKPFATYDTTNFYSPSSSTMSPPATVNTSDVASDGEQLSALSTDSTPPLQNSQEIRSRQGTPTVKATVSNGEKQETVQSMASSRYVSVLESRIVELEHMLRAHYHINQQVRSLC